MHAKLVAVAAALIFGSAVGLAGDDANSRIFDHQPGQPGADRTQPNGSADGRGGETLEHEGKTESLGAWGVRPGGEKTPTR